MMQTEARLFTALIISNYRLTELRANIRIAKRDKWELDPEKILDDLNRTMDAQEMVINEILGYSEGENDANTFTP